MKKWIFCQVKRAKFFKKLFLKVEKSIDIYTLFCYNITVAWRDGRVGLRRTTGNRVYPNRYQGFESLSLRHAMPPRRVAFLLRDGEKEDSEPFFLLCKKRGRRLRAERVKLACKRQAQISSLSNTPLHANATPKGRLP